MDALDRSIERALAVFGELVAEEPALAEELDRSFELFASDGEPADPELARRHLEWFVLERPSEHLGSTPVEALQEPFLERAGVDRGALPALLGSRAGAFEVTGVEAGEGLWLRDLFGMGEYPVQEPGAAAELRPGDLVVGRLFAREEGLFSLSHAAGCFRDPALLEALRDDAARLRANRRGTMRIEQAELERLFFRPLRDAEGAAEASTPEELLQELADAGMDAETARGVAAELEAAREEPAGGDPVTEILNALALRTDADLEQARRALVRRWGPGRRSAPRPAGADAAPAPARAGPASSDEPAPQRRVQEALAEFDRGRAAGRDLEQLFRDLERDLGVDAGDGDADEAVAPDFPGVVGAMVDEFLWETAREQGASAASARRCLQALSRYAGRIGLLEDLGPRELLDFAGRWLLQDADPLDEAAARELLAALADFCRWVEERHAHPLWTPFESTWRALEAAVPRLAAARAAAADAGLVPGPGTPAAGVRLFTVETARPERLRLAARGQAPREVEVPAAVGRHLRPGDLVRARVDGGNVRLEGFYPAAIRPLAADS